MSFLAPHAIFHQSMADIQLIHTRTTILLYVAGFSSEYDLIYVIIRILLLHHQTLSSGNCLFNS